ncbi:MAG: nitroreductase [Luteitalea sp.]|nr:nitroreductase [Luteitalea sp.]
MSDSTRSNPNTLEPLRRRNLTLEFLLNRRSISALVEPGPTQEQLTILLRAATTVPDHGCLRPYRFVVVPRDGQDAFGTALVAAAEEHRPDLPPEAREKIRKKAFAAPTRIVLIASPRDDGKIPEWEQITSASCTGYAIVLAALAQGLGAAWRSSPVVEGRALSVLFAMRSRERVLGWVNVGSPARALTAEERRPPDLTAFVSVLGANGVRQFAPAPVGLGPG